MSEFTKSNPCPCTNCNVRPCYSGCEILDAWELKQTEPITKISQYSNHDVRRSMWDGKEQTKHKTWKKYRAKQYRN